MSIEESKKPEGEQNDKPKEKIKKYRATNRRVFWWVFAIIVMICLAVFCFIKEMVTPGLVVLGISWLFFLPIIFTPVKYLFTKKDVIIVYFFNVNEHIEWSEVKKIVQKGKYYQIDYKRKRKYPFYVSSEILKTRRTRKLLNKLYKKEIHKS